MASLPPLRYVKMNGLGNEIVVVDTRGGTTTLDGAAAAAIAARPDTHFDQLMLLAPPRTSGSDGSVTIFNSDGSQSAACGNGTRCIAWYEAGRTGRSAFRFDSAAGPLAVTVKDQGSITVDMGEPRFDWRDIPLSEPFHNTRAIELEIGPTGAPILHSPSVVSMGNPHAVFWVDDVMAYDLAAIGPLLENHPLFPERANITLATVRSRKALRIRTWERGAGLTLACGTAACAAAVSAMRKNLTDRSVTVTLPGGDLAIEWTAENRVLMTGPVAVEHEGRLGEPATAET